MIPPVQLYIFVSAVFFLLYTNTLHFYINQEGDLSTFEFYVGKEDPRLKYKRSREVDFDSLKREHSKLLIIYDQFDSLYKVTPFEFSWDYLEIPLARNTVRFALDNGLYSNGEVGVALMNLFIKSIPKMFFVLLPWFALLLWLFFSQGRKFLYVDHAVFALHLHTFTFISVITGVFVKFLITNEWITAVFMTLLPAVYFFVALANFYRRRWYYTALAGTTVLGLYVASLTFVVLANMVLAVLLA